MGCTVPVLTVAESSSFGWRRPAERLNSHPASQNRPAPLNERQLRSKLAMSFILYGLTAYELALAFCE